MYVSVAIGILSSTNEWKMFFEKAEASRGIRLILIVAVCAMLVRLALIWLAARKRQNWARWALLVLILVGLPQFLKTLGPLFHENLLAWTSLTARFALDVVALIFVFTGDARDWFNPTLGPLGNVNPGSSI